MTRSIDPCTWRRSDSPKANQFRNILTALKNLEVQIGRAKDLPKLTLGICSADIANLLAHERAKKKSKSVVSR